eukprot:scaffold39234_cov44-Prasinocladus_malaysianus.AAC.1
MSEMRGAINAFNDRNKAAIGINLVCCGTQVLSRGHGLADPGVYNSDGPDFLVSGQTQHMECLREE